jgi:hypothetical protein
MTIQEIQLLREEKPFKPFRILTADGRKYDVLHPELFGQSASGRLISIAMPDDSFVILDLLLAAKIQRGIKGTKKNASKRN